MRPQPFSLRLWGLVLCRMLGWGSQFWSKNISDVCENPPNNRHENESFTEFFVKPICTAYLFFFFDFYWQLLLFGHINDFIDIKGFNLTLYPTKRYQYMDSQYVLFMGTVCTQRMIPYIERSHSQKPAIGCIISWKINNKSRVSIERCALKTLRKVQHL